MHGVRKMKKAIGILRDYVKKDLNIEQLEILLHLAVNEPEPVSYSTLSKLMDNSIENISRNIEMLSGHYLKDPTNGEWVDTGLGLVKTSPSPYDLEDHVVFLTDRGTKVVWILNELIK